MVFASIILFVDFYDTLCNMEEEVMFRLKKRYRTEDLGLYRLCCLHLWIVGNYIT